jgi:hypothetical protein
MNWKHLTPPMQQQSSLEAHKYVGGKKYLPT